MPMHNGKIAFAYDPRFPDATQPEGGLGILRNQDDSAGLAVESIDHLGFRIVAQIEPHTANEAGIGVSLGGMADKASRLVDDQQIVGFVDNGKEQARQGPSCAGGPTPPQNSRART